VTLPPNLIAYLSHPFNAPTEAGRLENLGNARAWIRWLVDATPWAISAPWIPYVETLDEETYRPRGLADQRTIIARHDLVIACGGRYSSGMLGDAQTAHEHKIPTLDLTALGVRPPAVPVDRATAIMSFALGKAIGPDHGIRTPRTIAEAVSWIAGYFDDLGLPEQATEIREGRWRSTVAPPVSYMPTPVLNAEEIAELRAAVHVIKAGPMPGAARLVERFIMAAEERLTE
jgi:hypothetical protein